MCPRSTTAAQAATEFDTIAELRNDTETRLREQIDEEVEGLFRAAAVDELLKATNFVAVGPLVEARTRELLSGLARSLQARGIDADSYLQLTGQSPEVLEQRLRAEASLSVSRELLLEAVADKLGIQVSDDGSVRSCAPGDRGGAHEEFIEKGGADSVRDDIREPRPRSHCRRGKADRARVARSAQIDRTPEKGAAEPRPRNSGLGVRRAHESACPMVVEQTSRGERVRHLPRRSPSASSSWAHGRRSDREPDHRPAPPLESEDPKDIFYINSPGGPVYSGLAIYDTMQFIKPDVRRSASASR